jgi:carbon storage regulator CsrA
MLILSRRVGEKIVVVVPPSTAATEVTVEVTSVGASQIKLGLNAPKTVSIYRSELPPERRCIKTG